MAASSGPSCTRANKPPDSVCLHESRKRPTLGGCKKPLGLPNWPAISEPAYTALIFETACQGARCTRAAYVSCDSVFVHGRFCSRCAKLQLLSRDEIKRILPDLPISLVSQLPLSKHRANADGTSETGLFYPRTDVLKLWSLYEASKSQGFTKQSAEQRLLPTLKAAKRENSIVADQVWAWFKMDATSHCREANRHLADLWFRLRAGGWKKRDYPRPDRDWVRLLDKGFYSPLKNNEAWNATIRSFEKLLCRPKIKAGNPSNNTRPFTLHSRNTSALR